MRNVADNRLYRVLRSVAAVIAGAVAVVGLSIGTDIALNAIGVMSPESEPEKFSAALWILLIAYRSLYAAGGSYLSARPAPSRPMMHAMVLGFIGLAANVAGLIVMWGVGPAWYPIALTVLALPSAWLGGRLYAGAA